MGYVFIPAVPRLARLSDDVIFGGFAARQAPDPNVVPRIPPRGFVPHTTIIVGPIIPTILSSLYGPSIAIPIKTLVRSRVACCYMAWVTAALLLRPVTTTAVMPRKRSTHRPTRGGEPRSACCHRALIATVFGLSPLIPTPISNRRSPAYITA